MQPGCWVLFKMATKMFEFWASLEFRKNCTLEAETLVCQLNLLQGFYQWWQKICNFWSDFLRQVYTLFGYQYHYRLNSLTLFWLAESVQWMFEISARDVITAYYTIIMSRPFKVTGYQVMYGRLTWFLRAIMSSSRALCCLPSITKQKHEFFISFNV